MAEGINEQTNPLRTASGMERPSASSAQADRLRHQRHQRHQRHLFMSYTHDPDGAWAAGLQRDIGRISTTMLGLRLSPVRVYRDQLDLSASADFWTELLTSLSQVDYLLVVASECAAGSDGVGVEIGHWFSSHPDPVGHLIIVVAPGNPADHTAVLHPTLLANAVEDHLTHQLLLLEADSFQRRRPRWPLSWLTPIGPDEELYLAAKIVAKVTGRSVADVTGNRTRALRRRLVVIGVVVIVAVLAVVFALVADRRGAQAKEEALAAKLLVIPDQDIIGERMRDETYANRVMDRSDWHGSTLIDIRFVSSGGEDVRMTETYLDRVSFSNVDLPGVDFSCRSVTADVPCLGARMREVVVDRGSDLSGADFNFTDLTDVRIEDADLEDATFIGATGQDLTFVNVDLRNANFRSASIEDVRFEKVCFDERTVWPDRMLEPELNRAAACR